MTASVRLTGFDLANEVAEARGCNFLECVGIQAVLELFQEMNYIDDRYALRYSEDDEWYVIDALPHVEHEVIGYGEDLSDAILQAWLVFHEEYKEPELPGSTTLDNAK